MSAELGSRSDRRPPEYREGRCAECGAPFTPTSGRQRFCEFHRGAKFATARKTAAKFEQRHSERGWRPPTRLDVTGVHHLRERKTSVPAALRLARELHKISDERCARELVELAERTAGGTFRLWGCHDLADLVVHYEMEHRSPGGLRHRSLVKDLDIPAGVVEAAEGLTDGAAFRYWLGWFHGLGVAEPYARALAWEQLPVSPFARSAHSPTEANGDMPASR